MSARVLLGKTQPNCNLRSTLARNLPRARKTRPTPSRSLLDLLADLGREPQAVGQLAQITLLAVRIDIDRDQRHRVHLLLRPYRNRPRKFAHVQGLRQLVAQETHRFRRRIAEPAENRLLLLLADLAVALGR